MTYNIAYCDGCGWKKKIILQDDSGEYCADCVEIESEDGTVKTVSELQKVDKIKLKIE